MIDEALQEHQSAGRNLIVLLAGDWRDVLSELGETALPTGISRGVAGAGGRPVW